MDTTPFLTKFNSVQTRGIVKTIGFTWETDFYAPPELGGAALFDNSAPAVYKNPVP